MPVPEKIKIVEVGPRDGLQNIKTRLTTEARAQLVENLVKAGLTHIEVGSFVSPVAVPQMADSAEVFKQVKAYKDVTYSALTPNFRGFQEAMAAGANEVAVFASASEGFSQSNINCSIAESLERFVPILEAARKEKVKVRGYLSCVMGCPFDGHVMPDQVAAISREMLDMGCYEISLGDTIGVGTVNQCRQLIESVKKKNPIESIAAHFHNTYGQALVNIYAAIKEGVSVVDASIRGLGGCPYAPGAAGNVATEDVVYMLDGMGIFCGVDRQKLLEVPLRF